MNIVGYLVRTPHNDDLAPADQVIWYAAWEWGRWRYTQYRGCRYLFSSWKEAYLTMINRLSGCVPSIYGLTSTGEEILMECDDGK